MNQQLKTIYVKYKLLKMKKMNIYKLEFPFFLLYSIGIKLFCQGAIKNLCSCDYPDLDCHYQLFYYFIFTSLFKMLHCIYYALKAYLMSTYHTKKGEKANKI